MSSGFLRPGTGWMIASVFSFALMAVSVKILGEAIPTMEKVFCRSLVSVVATGWAMRRQAVSWRPKRPGLLALRALLGFGGIFCYLEAIVRIPLGNAVVLHATNPLFAGLVAAIFLKEAYRRRQLLAALIGLVGVAFVAQPSPEVPLVGSVIGLCCGLFAGSAYATVRGLSRVEHPLWIVLSFPLLSIPLTLMLGAGSFVWPQGEQWFWLAVLGVTTQAGQVCLTHGLRLETAARATQFGYLGVIFGLGFGVLLGDAWPGALALVGSALIVAATTLNVASDKS